MRPEDQLDALLDQQLSGRMQRAAVSDELRPLISAAARLDNFRDAMPSSAFSHNLEARLLAHMSQSAGAAPVHERSSASSRRPVEVVFDAIPLRTRMAWAGIAAALFVTIGLGALTAKAAPGSPLYAVRQVAQSIAAHALPAPSVDTAALVAQLQADLATYDQAIAQGDTSAALSALAKLRTDDQHAAKLIATIPDAKASVSAQAQLAAFHSTSNGDLRASLSRLNLQGRAEVTDLLRDWGFTSLVVTRAHISADSKSTSTSHDTHGSSTAPDTSTAGTIIVDVHGNGFDSDAKVLINGQAYSNVLQVNSTEISVRVEQSALGAGQVVIGVENADGTVAFAPTAQRDETGGSGAAVTPSPTSKDGEHQTPSVTPTVESSNP